MEHFMSQLLLFSCLEMGRLSSGGPNPSTTSPVQQQTGFITLRIYFWALKVKHPSISCKCLSEELGVDCGLRDSPDGGSSRSCPI